MAMVITQNSKDTYLVKIAEPELSWIIEAAKGMGMDRCSILGASINKGLEHYFTMIREIEQHEKDAPMSDVKDRTTFDKGSCQS